MNKKEPNRAAATATAIPVDTTAAAATAAAPPVDTAEYPIGCVVHATAVWYDPNLRQLMFNRDMLAGPPKDSGEPPWIWGVRITKGGSNGYYHEPDWQEFHASDGTACITIGVHEGNRVATFVRVESEEIAKQKGPDAYGYSR